MKREITPIIAAYLAGLLEKACFSLYYRNQQEYAYRKARTFFNIQIILIVNCEKTADFIMYYFPNTYIRTRDKNNYEIWWTSSKAFMINNVVHKYLVGKKELSFLFKEYEQYYGTGRTKMIESDKIKRIEISDKVRSINMRDNPKAKRSMESTQKKKRSKAVGLFDNFI
jgi:hypothetical protein